MRGLWRSLSGGRSPQGWWVLVVAALVAVGVSAWVSTWSPRGAWAALGSVASAVGGVWLARGLGRRDAAGADDARLRRDLCLDVQGRLPRVDRYADPVALGVHPAAALDGDADDRVPLFVQRDMGGELERALGPGRFVLVIGESTAGKSRAAFEAMRLLRGPWRVIEPVGREAVATAVRVAQRSRWPCVVWLDDLERFLGTGGLTRADLQGLVHGQVREHCVIATMRTEEYARFTRAGRGSAERVGLDAQRRGEEVLALARQIRIPRAWSPAEVNRARAESGDPRLRDAVAYAGTFGIAEYLAAGPRLLHDWQDAWAPGAHPRGASLVAASVLARRCGIHRPLPERVLSRAAEPYLAVHGGALLRPEPLSEALAWASSPLHATSSLLVPTEGGYRVFDYLIDALPKTVPPAAALEALITVATLDEAVDLAYLARDWFLYDQAEQAARRVLDHPEAEQRDQALGALAGLVYLRQGAKPALEFSTGVARERAERLGECHPETLGARLIRAGWLSVGQGVARALSECLALLPMIEQVEGTDAQRTLSVRLSIADFRAGLGQWAEAAWDYQRLAADWSRVSGPANWWAIYCRTRHAVAVGNDENAAAAVLLLRKLLLGLDIPTDSEPHRLVRSALAHQLSVAGDYREAMLLRRELLADSERRNGPEHRYSLHLRCLLAECLGYGGDPATAVDMLKDVVRMHSPVQDERLDTSSLYFRRCLAVWTGMAGDPGQAAEQLREIATLAVRLRGKDDPFTLGCRLRAAHWTATYGDTDSGIRELESTLQRLQATAGSLDDDTRTCREQLEHWRAIARASTSGSTAA